MRVTIAGLYQCQYPGCNIILHFCKMLPLVETGQSVQGISIISYNYPNKNFS